MSNINLSKLNIIKIFNKNINFNENIIITFI